MSAKEELIAAALTAADKIDRFNHVWHLPIETAAELREACARAMVQPAATHMAEVERLVREYGNACRSDAVDVIATGDDPESCGAAHAALLDYVRGVLAERDHFRGVTKMVPAASDPDPLHLSRILHELAGAASMCWTPRPSTAVFDSQQAIVFVEQAIAEIRQRMQMMSAAPQPVGEPAENSYEWFQREIQRLQKHVAVTWPDWMKRTSGLSTATFPTVGAAEVPMPDVAGELFNGRKVCDEADVRTYGDAREAAGYAAGVAAVRDYAVMRWCAEVSNRPLVNTHRRTLDDTWRQVIRHTGGDPETLIGPCHDVLVALRGEVKP